MIYKELLVLRLLAIILVVNSHLDLLYPVKYMATGGALGNAIFFLISSIGITFSLDNQKMPFFKWYLKKFLRIYPLMWFVIILYIAVGFIEFSSTKDLIKIFLIPHTFWFLPAIIIFYIPLYYFVTIKSKKFEITLLFILLFCYLFFYINDIDKTKYSIENYGFFKHIFYLIVVLLGVYIARNYNNWKLSFKKSILFLGLSFFGFYGFKFIELNFVLYTFQFI